MGEIKDYPPYLDYPKPYKPHTNADRIRSMTDEELATFISELLTNVNKIRSVINIVTDAILSIACTKVV